MPIQTPQDPRFGSRISASEFRNRVTNPLVANDTSLESRLTALELALAALPQEYRQANIPTTAKFKDHWIDPSDNEQLYFCVETYGEGEADKIHKWVAIGDSTARATAQTAVTTAGQATRIIIDDEPPISCERGWTWTDTSTSNRDMRCMTSYAETDGPDAYPSLDAFRRSRFEPTDSHIGSLLAAAEQGLKDGKSNTLFQAEVPASADGRDIWVDTDNNNGTFACFASYRTTDHDPYDSLKTYVAGEIVTYLGNMYQAKSGGSPAGNVPSNVMYWLLLGTAYANQTLFRESRWAPISDSVARSMAQAAQGIADGKTTNFYQPDYPTGADFKDSFINSTTNQAYICIQAYNADTVLPETRHEMWEAIADTVARDAADAKDSITDGIINTYLQATIPASAGVKDIWFNTAEQYQAYVCIAQYAVGGDMTFWKPLTDKSKTSTYQVPTMPESANMGDTWVQSNEKQFICLQTYSAGTGILAVNWQPVADTFRAVYYLPDPPPAAQKGDGWLDTFTPEGRYQFYVCNENYSNGEHGWTSLESAGKWTPSRDIGAQTTATLALNTANGKTTTYYQTEMPDTAKRGDQWVDTNNPYLDTGLYVTYLCIDPYPAGTGTLNGNWTEYADPVAMKTAQDAMSIADGKRKIVYNASVPRADDYGGFDLGDGWMDSDDFKFYICKTPHTTGTNIDFWQESTNSQAEQAMQIALDAQAVQDGVRQTYTTAGAGDTFWPGPGGANQWPISNWATAGAKVGDVWFHKNVTNGVYSLRHCIVAYSGFADGSMGSLANWATFTDPDMEANFAASIALVESTLNSSISSLGSATSASLATKMDKAGGTFTGAVGFVSTQTYDGASMVLSGNAHAKTMTVFDEPTTEKGVVRKKELDEEAYARISERGTAKTIHVSDTGTGDLSGVDDSNRMPVASLATELHNEHGYTDLCVYHYSNATINASQIYLKNKNVRFIVGVGFTLKFGSLKTIDSSLHCDRACSLEALDCKSSSLYFTGVTLSGGALIKSSLLTIEGGATFKNLTLISTNLSVTGTFALDSGSEINISASNILCDVITLPLSSSIYQAIKDSKIVSTSTSTESNITGSGGLKFINSSISTSFGLYFNTTQIINSAITVMGNFYNTSSSMKNSSLYYSGTYGEFQGGTGIVGSTIVGGTSIILNCNVTTSKVVASSIIMNSNSDIVYENSSMIGSTFTIITTSPNFTLQTTDLSVTTVECGSGTTITLKRGAMLFKTGYSLQTPTLIIQTGSAVF